MGQDGICSFIASAKFLQNAHHAAKIFKKHNPQVFVGENDGKPLSGLLFVSRSSQLKRALKPLNCREIPITLEQPTRLRILWGASPHTINCLYSDG